MQKQRCYSRSSLFYWLCPNNKTLTQERREIKRSEQYSKIRSKKLCYASSSPEGELAFYFLYGVQSRKRELVRYLWEKEKISVKGLGEEYSGTLTPVLKRLEERGLIIRERSKEDERSVIITLTTEGNEFKEKVTMIPNAVFDKTGCNEEEIKSYNKEIRNLLNMLTTEQ